MLQGNHMTKNNKRYDITQCALYKCKSKRRLAMLLNYDLKIISKFLGHYHSFKQQKKDSNEFRDITAPNNELKKIQSRILRLLEKVNRQDWLISGEKGKCYIDNGRYHINSNFVLTMDIRKFYDNCKREYVYQFFINKLQTSPDIAKILTDILTYKGIVPTGCPTSQIIAFYAYYDMFLEINQEAEKLSCIFTLYVDDMTFSSKNPFMKDQLIRRIDCILRKYGHKPKYKKVKYYSKGAYKLITGVVLTPNHTLLAPNKNQKKVYDEFKSMKKDVKTYGVKYLRTNTVRKKLRSLKGKLHAIKNIDKIKFPEMTRIVCEWESC